MPWPCSHFPKELVSLSWRLLLRPIEIGPEIGALDPARLTNEQRLEIGQAIRPAIADDRNPMAALVVGAVDQQATNAHLAHFTQRDFLRTYASPTALPAVDFATGALR
jgi:hypothetical protein